MRFISHSLNKVLPHEPHELLLSLLFNLYSTIRLNGVVLSKEVHPKTNQTSKIEFFGKLVTDVQPLTFFPKSSILDILLGCEYASEIIYTICIINSLQTISNIHPRIHKRITIKIQKNLI